MRIIRQARLHYQQGNSDKVYEVDLCEAGPGEYVVNFRYGRRGNTLREGTKTTFPVSEADAESTFQDLVESKRKKGYRFQEEEPPPSDPAQAEIPGTEDHNPSETPRGQRILQYLKAAASGHRDPAPNWPLSRLLWRAGELRLKEAEPSLIQIAGDGDMVDHALAWALGRCGTAASLDALRDLEATSKFEPAKRLCEAALLAFEQEEGRAQQIAAIQQRFPPGFSDAWKPEVAHRAEGLHTALRRLRSAWTPLYDLYLLSPYIAHLRDDLLALLEYVPFAARSFKGIRQILKLAEFRDDDEVLGLLYYRLEHTPESYRSQWGHVVVNGNYIRIEKAMSQPDPGVAYSNKTRAYLRRRSLRMLQNCGTLNQDRYCRLATETLLHFVEEDRKKPRRDYTYDWSSRSFGEIWYDEWDYPLLNQILYRNSPRYEASSPLTSWRCQGDYQPGHAAPEQREEAFPEIWNRNPDSVFRLLRESGCSAVLDMAVKIFRANPEFATRVSIGDLVAFLQHSHAGTAELAMELARSLYDPEHPHLELVIGLATCPVTEARQLALGWMNDQPEVFYTQQSVIAALLLCPDPDLHRTVREQVPRLLPTETWMQELAMDVFPRLMALEASEETAALVREAGETLLTIAGPALAVMDLGQIHSLLSHSEGELQAFGARLLLHHQTPAEQLDDSVFDTLLEASSPAARRAGVELFGSLPDEVLLTRYAVIAKFATSPHVEMRQQAHPIIERLAAQNAQFSREFVEQLYPLLARKERFEGLHDDLYTLLTGPLSGQLEVIPDTHMSRLIDCPYARAQELGGHLLATRDQIGQLPMRRLVTLASHEQASIRELARSVYLKMPQRVTYELEEAVRIVDSDWEDTQAFAFSFFREQLREEEWNPDVLISIADSVKPEVRAFGRELITRYFQEEHGTTYLLKLSQHPSADLQMFVSNYLERFASGSLTRLTELEPYFVTVLCQVNRGRVAKDRVLAFLTKEAMHHEEVAKLAIRIFNRQAATMAVGDRAGCIEAIAAIQRRFPSIDRVMTLVEPPTREVC